MANNMNIGVNFVPNSRGLSRTIARVRQLQQEVNQAQQNLATSSSQNDNTDSKIRELERYREEYQELARAQQNYLSTRSQQRQAVNNGRITPMQLHNYQNVFNSGGFTGANGQGDIGQTLAEGERFLRARPTRVHPNNYVFNQNTARQFPAANHINQANSQNLASAVEQGVNGYNTNEYYQNEGNHVSARRQASPSSNRRSLNQYRPYRLNGNLQSTVRNDRNRRQSRSNLRRIRRGVNRHRSLLRSIRRGTSVARLRRYSTFGNSSQLYNRGQHASLLYNQLSNQLNANRNQANNRTAELQQERNQYIEDQGINATRDTGGNLEPRNNSDLNNGQRQVINQLDRQIKTIQRVDQAYDQLASRLNRQNTNATNDIGDFQQRTQKPTSEGGIHQLARPGTVQSMLRQRMGTMLMGTGAIVGAELYHYAKSGNQLRQQIEPQINSTTMGNAINGGPATYHADDLLEDRLSRSGEWLGKNTQQMAGYAGALSTNTGDTNTNQIASGARQLAQFSRLGNVSDQNTNQLFGALGQSGALGNNPTSMTRDLTQAFTGALRSQHLGARSDQQAQALGSIYSGMANQGQLMNGRQAGNIMALQQTLSSGALGRSFQGQAGAEGINNLAQGIASNGFQDPVQRAGFALGNEGNYAGQQGMYRQQLAMSQPLKHPNGLNGIIQEEEQFRGGPAGAAAALVTQDHVSANQAEQLVRMSNAGRLNSRSLSRLRRRDQRHGRGTERHARRQYRMQGNSTLDIKVAMTQSGKMRTSETNDTNRNAMNHARGTYDNHGAWGGFISGAGSLISGLGSIVAESIGGTALTRGLFGGISSLRHGDGFFKGFKSGAGDSIRNDIHPGRETDNGLSHRARSTSRTARDTGNIDRNMSRVARYDRGGSRVSRILGRLGRGTTRYGRALRGIPRYGRILGGAVTAGGLGLGSLSHAINAGRFARHAGVPSRMGRVFHRLGSTREIARKVPRTARALRFASHGNTLRRLGSAALRHPRLARGGSRLLGRDIPIFGDALTGLSDLHGINRSNKGRKLGGAAGDIGGGAAGASAGAALGSAVPGIGNVVGAIGGGILGSIGGGSIGHSLGSKIGSLFDHHKTAHAASISPRQRRLERREMRRFENHHNPLIHLRRRNRTARRRVSSNKRTTLDRAYRWLHKFSHELNRAKQIFGQGWSGKDPSLTGNASGGSSDQNNALSPYAAQNNVNQGAGNGGNKTVNIYHHENNSHGNYNNNNNRVNNHMTGSGYGSRSGYYNRTHRVS